MITLVKNKLSLFPLTREGEGKGRVDRRGILRVRKQSMDKASAFEGTILVVTLQKDWICKG